VVIKGKPVPCGLKYWVLSESETGYIHYAELAHEDAAYEFEEYGRTFGLIFDVLSGRALNDGIHFLDQGYIVCQSTRV